ncbi:hypothetical protein JCM11641_006919 [Rhodosporidiobolus odoratus]
MSMQHAQQVEAYEEFRSHIDSIQPVANEPAICHQLYNALKELTPADVQHLGRVKSAHADSNDEEVLSPVEVIEDQLSQIAVAMRDWRQARKLDTKQSEATDIYQLASAIQHEF